MAGRTETVDAPQPKRQKVDVACDLCRSKKIKCDSVRPVCGPCSKKESNALSCSWEGHLSRIQQPSRAEVLRLRRRIEELEARTVAQGTGTDDNIRDIINDNTEGRRIEARRQNRTNNSSLDAEVHNVGHDPTTPVSLDATLNFAENEATGDRVPSESAQMFHAPAVGVTKSLASDRHYFGTTSAINFLGQMRNAVQQKFGVSGQTILPDRDALHSTIMGTTARPRHKPLDYVLPGRRKADGLLAIYWDLVQPLYPFLDKQDVLARYERLWLTQVNEKDDPVFICSLNLVFALSSQLNEDMAPSARQSCAEEFFERAKESLDLWHLNTLQSVQMLLLLNMYLQSSCAINECWMILGVAIRTAQSLGLHQSETSLRIGSLRERELVRKVWYTCVFLDRMSAMTYGRPSMIVASLDPKVPLPLPTDDEDLSSGKGISSTCSGASTIDFFVQTIRLFEILAEVLVRYYPGQAEDVPAVDEMLEKLLGQTQTGSQWSILEVDRRLLDWARRLPNHLRIEQSSRDCPSSNIFNDQAVILRRRFLHTRLLSLRPILLAYLSCEESDPAVGTTSDVSLSRRIAVQCGVVCVKVAQELIDFDHIRRPSDPNAVGLIAAWWNNVLFVYSAATVLVAARLSPSILNEISEDSIMKSWFLAIEVLQSYQVFNPLIQRCVSALELIHRVIPERLAAPRHLSQRQATNEIEVQNMPSQLHGSGLLGHDLPSVPAHAEGQMSESFLNFHGNDLLDNNLLFGMNDISWLGVAPFEL